MARDPNKYQDLSRRLDQALKKQQDLQREITDIRRELEQWHRPGEKPATVSQPSLSRSNSPSKEEEIVARSSGGPWKYLRTAFQVRPDWEKFIGENLISKIGILITVIGVAFGTKYAIDHELISPLSRVILGYFAGMVLVGFAMRLKTKYENFSAVLLSGGLAVFYIITYFAYHYYALIPESVAFLMMALFTAFTVLAAWHYDRQIIALMGLVGAYGVPFLISEDSGNATVLLAYISLINSGILIIAFRKYWKGLFSTAFWLSWLIFSWWMIFGYEREYHFTTGLLFNTVFFLLFYGTILAYKLLKKEAYRWTDIALLLTNSFIFFGFGYGMLNDHSVGEQFLGLFALANAGLHFGVGMLIRKDKLADRNLFYFVIGLVLVFISIAIPVQLDGSWVTLLWSGEAALLFWLGRSRRIKAYEKMCLPLVLLAFGSLVQDWSASYGISFYEDPEQWLSPVFNSQLLNSLLVSGIFGGMVWFHFRNQDASPLPKDNLWRQALRFVLPSVFLLTLYFTFRQEIQYYFQMRSHLLAENMSASNAGSATYHHLGMIWTIYYSLGFLAALSLVNMRWIRDKILGISNLLLNIYGLFFFLVGGLFSLSFLNEAYILTESGGFILTSGLQYLRYLGYAIVAGLLFITYHYQQQDFIPLRSAWPYDALLHLVALVLLSNELMHLLERSGTEDADKLGLSILWGVYALFAIALGIAQRKSYLRIGAIVLFAITLLKLFFYDIAHLSTMHKTIVLLSLGILLLLISFLYNKFKHLIFNDVEV